MHEVEPTPMLIAHLTDLHVRPRGVPAYRVVETNMLTARAIEAVRCLRPAPDCLILSGDLTDCGLEAEYRELGAMLAGFPAPVYAVPGSHDRREVLRRVLPHLPGMGADPEFVQYTVEDHPVRLLMLDTGMPGAGHGALCGRRIDWLRGALRARPDAPTMIVMHHPPFVCGIDHMDAIRLLDGEPEFRAIVAENRQVERIVCGHHHRPIHVRYAGTIATTSAGVAHQVALDLVPDAAGVLLMEPATYQLHRWSPGAGLVSHQGYVERFEGPYPFLRDPDYPGAPSEA